MDTLAAMKSFVRAVELGSFSRAAEEAGAKVSTVSRHVGALEADLGAALLNRSTHGLHLTEVGTAFYEQAKRIVFDVQEARSLANSLNGAPQGVLRINMPAAFGRLHVMPHLAAFLAAYPAIRVDATLADARVDLVEAGVDVAIRIGALPDSRLVARRLAPHRRIACTSPDQAARLGPSAARRTSRAARRWSSPGSRARPGTSAPWTAAQSRRSTFPGACEPTTRKRS